MKKYAIPVIISTLVLGSLLSVVAETNTKFSSKFIKNFRDCDSYEETITSTFENQTFTTNRKIVGWRNGSCRYEETITSPKDKYKLSCDFNGIQVDELYDAMKSKSRTPEKYELEIYALQTDPKTGRSSYSVVGTQTIKGNKAYITWAKIQNNPYFCTSKKLQ